jgi:hypothetical protein
MKSLVNRLKNAEAKTQALIDDLIQALAEDDAADPVRTSYVSTAISDLRIVKGNIAMSHRKRRKVQAPMVRTDLIALERL